MKARLATLFLAGMISSGSSLAQPPSLSPLVGAWMVDVSRLPMAPAARPRRVRFRFTDSAAGNWTIEVDITDANGLERKSTVTATPDGSSSPVEGDNIEADIAAIKMPQPDVMILVLGKRGSPGSTRIYAVAADGKSMVETATYFDKEGAPILRTNYLARAE
jgi:hypothetical protein